MNASFQYSPKITSLLQEIVRVNIEYYRVKNESTKSELSKKIGYCGSYLGKIERGEKIPSLIVLCRLAQVLDRSINDFFKLNIPCFLENLTPLPQSDDRTTEIIFQKLRNICNLRADALLLIDNQGTVKTIRLFTDGACDYLEPRSIEHLGDVSTSPELKPWYKKQFEKLFHLDVNWTTIPAITVGTEPISLRFLFGVRITGRSRKVTKRASIIGLRMKTLRETEPENVEATQLTQTE